MSFLKDRHLLIAMVTAPVLALVAYFGIDLIVGESPHAAKEGQNYRLAEKPNCRYQSGRCGMKNGDFELNLSREWLGDERMVLTLESEFPLDGVLVALVKNKSSETPPVSMSKVDAGGSRWTHEMARPNPQNDRLRLVASSAGALYYADVATKFVIEETDRQ